MSKLLSSTPKEDGFRMPAEFEPHAGCWMLWPERSDNWRLGAKPAHHSFSQVASAISKFELLTMGVSSSQFINARKMLPDSVRVVEMSYNDSWIRDCGPTFVIDVNGTLRGIDWEFNAWGGLQGGLYFPWDLDNLVPQKVLEIERLDRYKSSLVFEGGSIHVDGQGTLITTEECLINPNRNPNLSKAQIEDILVKYLNLEKIIWLGKGVYNDETAGHVDNLVCFIKPGELALTWTDDRSDPQYDISQDAYERLISTTDARGRKFTINLIHQPSPIYITKEESEGVDMVNGTKPRSEGDRMPASYINFYIANGAVLVPIFYDPFDQPALKKLTQLFPNREIIGIYAREIILGGGNIHCITQQQPK